MEGEIPGLDTTDREIVSLLIGDTRISTRAIAQALGLPESTARARLKALIDKGTVRPTVVVHPLVEDHRLVYVTRLTVAEGTAELPEHPLVADAPWMGRVATQPVFFVQRAARTFDEFVAGVDALARIDGVAEVTHAMFLRLFVGSEWAGQAPAPRGWELNSGREMDAVDRTLIQGLRRDGRASYTALAQDVGLTVVATRRRVLRLVEDQAIRSITLVRSFSDEHSANLDLRVSPSDQPGLIEALCALPSMRYVAEQTGVHNLACHVVADSTPGLTKAISGILQDRRILAHQVLPFASVRDQLSWVPAAASS